MNEIVKLGIFDGKGMARGNVKVVAEHKKSAPLFHFDPIKHRIHYLFDPPLGVGGRLIRIQIHGLHPWLCMVGSANADLVLLNQKL